MTLEKITEINFTNNDISRLEIVDDMIVIDDTNQSLGVLDLDLKFLKKIPLVEQFCMYNTYICCDNKKILFDASDRNALLFVNLTTGENNVLDTTHIQGDFSRVYFWQSDYLVLVTRKGHFYHYQEKLNQLIKLSDSSVNHTFPQFVKFYQFYKKLLGKFDINSCNMSFVHESNNYELITFYDFKSDFNTSTQMPSKLLYHNVTYCDGVFVFVSEEMLFFRCENEIYKLFPVVGDIFKIVRFVKEGNRLFLIVFSSDKGDFFICKIEKYEIFKQDRPKLEWN